MKSYEEIARITGSTVEKVRDAFNAAEKIEIPHTFVNRHNCVEVACDRMWFVKSIQGCGYPSKEYRFQTAAGAGNTREDAVIDALTNAPNFIA